ncbi:MAG: cupin domain-containing protein [Rhodoblastus sp.]
MAHGGIEKASVEDIVRLLDLSPHPEGGFYRETFRDPIAPGGRAASTAIYFLLPGGAPSRWHRVDAAETWHFYAGAPLELTIEQNGARSLHRIGADLTAGERPQAIVPAGAWQAARSLGAWTLVGCTVAPGFEFAHFEVIDGEPR